MFSMEIFGENQPRNCAKTWVGTTILIKINFLAVPVCQFSVSSNKFKKFSEVFYFWRWKTWGSGLQWQNNASNYWEYWCWTLFYEYKKVWLNPMSKMSNRKLWRKRSSFTDTKQIWQHFLEKPDYKNSDARVWDCCSNEFVFQNGKYLIRNLMERIKRVVTKKTCFAKSTLIKIKNDFLNFRTKKLLLQRSN